MNTHYPGEHPPLLVRLLLKNSTVERQTDVPGASSVDPLTMMARLGERTVQHIRFVDTYGIARLIEPAMHVESARRRAAYEPRNAPERTACHQLPAQTSTGTL